MLEGLADVELLHGALLLEAADAAALEQLDRRDHLPDGHAQGVPDQRQRHLRSAAAATRREGDVLRQHPGPKAEGGAHGRGRLQAAIGRAGRRWR